MYQKPTNKSKDSRAVYFYLKMFVKKVRQKTRLSAKKDQIYV